MDEDELLENEQIEKVLSPHPFSFMKYQSQCFFLIIWGLFVFLLVTVSPIGKNIISLNNWLPLLIWGVALLLFGVLSSLITIKWIIFALDLTVFIVGFALVWSQNWITQSALFIVLYSIACAIIGFLIIEAHRRSHRYIISNFRIIFSEGVATKQERSLRYDKITSINTKQGIFGRIFGFGTIIPTTGHVEGGGHKKGKKAVAEAKDLAAPAIRNLYELHGVYPFKQVKKVLESLVQDTVITPYQKEQVTYQKQQVDIQKQMRDLLKKQVDPGQTEEKDESNEKTTRTTMFSKKIVTAQKPKEEKSQDLEGLTPEQIDIQKQMKDLLKKQEKVKVDQENVEQEEEPEDEQREIV